MTAALAAHPSTAGAETATAPWDRADSDRQVAWDTAVLIPARNEPALAETLASVARQTLTPAVVVVVLNNCTDGGVTRRAVDVAVAEHPHLACVVLEMVDNPERKAGALNHGLDHLLAHHPAIRWVAQMDADSLLDANFLAETVAAMRRPSNKRVAALSCVFTGRTDLTGSWWERTVMWHQRVEYTSFHDAAVARNVNVVSGTGCLLSVRALEQLREDRGQVWLGDSLVEDFELTLALRRAGWETRKSRRFRVYTDLMPTVGQLVEQRVRWQRGTFEELRRHGWNSVTRLEISRQWAHGAALLATLAGWVWFAFLAAHGQVTAQPAFLGLVALIAVRRAYHVRGLGVASVIAVVTLVPDNLYGLLRNYWWVKSLVLSFTSTQRSWT